MRQRLHHRMAYTVAVAVGAWLVALGTTPAAQDNQGQDRGAPRPESTRALKKHEKIDGVIVKVEPLAKHEGKEKTEKARRRHEARRLTINTAAVWRDWVRDQATATGRESTREAARKGADSIATKGEPESPDTLVTVEVHPDAQVETRYRSADDAVGEGSVTPEGTKDADQSASASRRDSGKGRSAGATHVELADLKPGLFVSIRFHRQGQRQRAGRVIVLRPIGGPQTPAKEATPAHRDQR